MNNKNLINRKKFLEDKLEEIKLNETGMLFSLLFKSEVQKEYDAICKIKVK